MTAADPAPAPAEAFARALARAFPEAPPAALGLAVSGGSDSMALLRLAADWAARRRTALQVATIDHGLRPEAADEAAMVAHAARALGLPHTVLRWDWDRHGNLQDAARRARFRLLADWARAGGLAAVLLGHTRNDQAETLLMRLARGSGVDGLAAMAEERVAHGARFLRPLLEVERYALRQVLRGAGQTWADDPTNDDDTSERHAEHALRRLVDGICAELPEVRAAIDDACLRPRQLIRCMGSTHRHGGRCIPLTLDDLLHTDALIWWGRSEATPHEPHTLPDPHTATMFSPALYRLLTTPPSKRQTSAKPLRASICCKPPSSTGTIAAIRDGVEEGRRNRSAYIMALYLLTNGREPPGSAWDDLKAWSERCSPPLPMAELRRCYNSATRSRAVRAQESNQPPTPRRSR